MTITFNSNYKEIDSVSKEQKSKSRVRKNTYKSSVATVSVLTGAAAISAVVIGGILLHKSQQISKSIKEVTNDVQKEIKKLSNRDNGYANLFDSKKINTALDETLKLPKKERLEKLSEIKNLLFDNRLSSEIINDDSTLEQNIAKLPINVQKAITEKDELLARRLFASHCDNEFYDSKLTGEVSNIIKKMYGESSGITPHTYDINAEEGHIFGYIYNGDLKDLMIDNDNKIASYLNRSAAKYINPEFISHFGSIGKLISEGTYNGTRITNYILDGKRYVTIQFNLGACEEGMQNCIVLVSKKGTELTPAQKDLLSLQGKLLKEDSDLFVAMGSNPASNDVYHVTAQDKVDGKSLAFMNYDLILSTIQSLANKYKA